MPPFLQELGEAYELALSKQREKVDALNPLNHAAVRSLMGR
jgi:hypothetical protein